MATNSVKPFKYADWRQQATLEKQRERLLLHIEELTQRSIKMSSRGRSMSLDDRQMESAKDDLREIDRKIALSRGVSGVFGTYAFVRGTGP